MGVNVRYFDWMEIVWSSDLSSDSKLICAYLSRFMNKDKDIAWPSQSRISAETGLGRSTINRKMTELETSGFLVRDSGNSKKTTRYTITIPSNHLSQLSQSGTINCPRAGQGLSQSGTYVVPERDTNISNNNINIIGRFTPPTIEQVSEYCRERGNGIDPQRFIDHYEANGWMRGKNKIKDWKACVRTWEQKTQEKPFDPTDHYV